MKEELAWGSALHHPLVVAPVWPESRRRCVCGCERRATHQVTANGVSLATGCELQAYRIRREFRPR